MKSKLYCLKVGSRGLAKAGQKAASRLSNHLPSPQPSVTWFVAPNRAHQGWEPSSP